MLNTIQSYKEKKSGQCAYVYIQFESMNGYEKFKSALDINKVKRFFMRQSGRQHKIAHKYLGGTGKGRCCGDGMWPKIKRAPDPSLIQWQNLGIGKIERTCRTLTVYAASGLMLLLGFIFILKMLQYKDESMQDDF